MILANKNDPLAVTSWDDGEREVIERFLEIFFSIQEEMVMSTGDPYYYTVEKDGDRCILTRKNKIDVTKIDADNPLYTYLYSLSDSELAMRGYVKTNGMIKPVGDNV